MNRPTDRLALDTDVLPAAAAGNVSAVAWGAIFAGAAAAAALSILLAILGVGLGLSSVSPWANTGASAAALGASTIVWLTLTQLIASGLGGYLAGRLRTKWVSVHGDEVHFRDTAHGLLSWAVATLATVMLVASTLTGVLSGGVQAGAALTGGAMSAAGGAAGGNGGMPGREMMQYWVDSLFRKDINATPEQTRPAAATANAGGNFGMPERNAPNVTAETVRIFMNADSNTGLLPDDVRYVGHLVAQQTGLTQQAAEQRVSETYTRLQTKIRDTKTAAQQAIDQGRKASAYAALWLFISLLIGAFVASLMATFGGRQRDT